MWRSVIIQASDQHWEFSMFIFFSLQLFWTSLLGNDICFCSAFFSYYEWDKSSVPQTFLWCFRTSDVTFRTRRYRIICIMMWLQTYFCIDWDYVTLCCFHDHLNIWCCVSPVDAPVRHRQKTVVTDMCYPAQISSLMDFGSPDCSLGKGTERLSEICSVAVVTADGVCSDTFWWLKETEWARPWAWHQNGGLCGSRVWEQSVTSSQFLIQRGQS